MIKEFCAENLTLLPTLDAGQVSRVELCDNLAVGEQHHLMASSKKPVSSYTIKRLA